MKPSLSSQPLIHVVDIKNMERWSIYHRLQELEIPCRCSTNRPLQVNLDNPLAEIQLWSVVKQVTGSRQELINWLARCWKIELRDNEKNN